MSVRPNSAVRRPPAFPRALRIERASHTAPPHRKEFERITEGLSDALEFTRTIGIGKDIVSYEQGGGRGALGEVDFYTRSVRPPFPRAPWQLRSEPVTRSC